MSKQPPPAPTAGAVGPCPTLIQTSRTPRHWKFAQDHRTTQPPLGVRDFNGFYHKWAWQPYWPCDPTNFLSSHKLSYTCIKFVKYSAVEELRIDHKLRCTDSRTERQMSEKTMISPFQRKEGVVVWRGRSWGVREVGVAADMRI